jgi:AcrR family transcriptional regulator
VTRVPASTASNKGAARRTWTRGQANADALRAAAHRLVLEQGENFTTQELIKEADVALQTFYRHFGGKDQILIAVIGDLVEAHCEALAARASAEDGPVERLRFYITETLTVMVGSGSSGAGRFMTSQHWRLHELHPAELAEADKPFADLVATELEAAWAEGLLAPRSVERDAWLINQLVMAVFHYYAFAEGGDAESIAEDVWQFTWAAVGGGASPPPKPRAAKGPARTAKKAAATRSKKSS